MLRTLAKRLTALILAVVILAPFPYVLIIPEYAFAEPNTPATYGGYSGSGTGSTASGSGVTTWGQAAASGAVSLGACLAAGSLNIASLTTGIAGFLGSIGASLGLSAAAPVVAAEVAPVAASAAGAALTVPVTDIAAGLQRTAIAAADATIQSAQNALLTQVVTLQLGRAMKQDVFDCIGWAIAKMIWRAIAASIIDWINNGFNGKPAFMQNFDRFLLGIADSIAGEVIQGAGLGFLCSPFQLNIRIALAMRYAQRAPSCTLTQVIANIDNFMKDFRQGGWGAWLQFTTSPQNNAYGGMLLGEATIAIRTHDAQSQQSQQLSWGGGFLSLTQQTCKQVPISINGAKPQMTEQCTSAIQTPGKLIGDKLTATVNAPELSLLMADELNQIIDAISQQLILQALNGVSKLSQPSSFGDDYYRFSTPTAELSGQDLGSPNGRSGGSFYVGDSTGGEPSTPVAGAAPGASELASQINTTTKNQEALLERIAQASDLIGVAIQNDQTIKSCWDEKASATSTSGLNPSDRAQAAVQSQQQSFKLISLGNSLAPYTKARSESEATILSLRALESRALQSTSAATLAAVSQEYYTKQSTGSYATSLDISRLDQSLLQLRTEAATLYQSALIDIEMCRYFPNPVPTQ